MHIKSPEGYFFCGELPKKGKRATSQLISQHISNVVLYLTLEELQQLLQASCAPRPHFHSPGQHNSVVPTCEKTVRCVTYRDMEPVLEAEEPSPAPDLLLNVVQV